MFELMLYKIQSLKGTIYIVKVFSIQSFTKLKSSQKYSPKLFLSIDGAANASESALKCKKLWFA